MPPGGYMTVHMRKMLELSAVIHHLLGVRLVLKTSCQLLIFTLPQIFLRWTYFRPTRVIHRWPISWSSDVTGKQTSPLVVETFDWRHLMMMAGEHNGWMRRSITFFRLVVCKLYIASSKIMRTTVVKNVNIKNGFCLRFIEVWTQWGVPHQSLEITYFARDPLCSNFDEPRKNEIYFLLGSTCTIFLSYKRPWALQFMSRLNCILETKV